MTKAEIRAELRRSACEDKDPWEGVSLKAFVATGTYWLNKDESMINESAKNLRIFFLLVAEAM